MLDILKWLCDKLYDFNGTYVVTSPNEIDKMNSLVMSGGIKDRNLSYLLGVDTHPDPWDTVTIAIKPVIGQLMKDESGMYFNRLLYTHLQVPVPLRDFCYSVAYEYACYRLFGRIDKRFDEAHRALNRIVENCYRHSSYKESNTFGMLIMGINRIYYHRSLCTAYAVLQDLINTAGEGSIAGELKRRIENCAFLKDVEQSIIDKAIFDTIVNTVLSIDGFANILFYTIYRLSGIPVKDVKGTKYSSDLVQNAVREGIIEPVMIKRVENGVAGIIASGDTVVFDVRRSTIDIDVPRYFCSWQVLSSLIPLVVALVADREVRVSATKLKKLSEEAPYPITDAKICKFV